MNEMRELLMQLMERIVRLESEVAELRAQLNNQEACE